jgi:hypothetical protein
MKKESTPAEVVLVRAGTQRMKLPSTKRNLFTLFNQNPVSISMTPQHNIDAQCKQPLHHLRLFQRRS